MFVGLDVHKRFCYATILSCEGVKVGEIKFLNTLDELDEFLGELDENASIVMGASSVWGPIYDRVEELGQHRLRDLGAFAEGRASTKILCSSKTCQRASQHCEAQGIAG